MNSKKSGLRQTWVGRTLHRHLDVKNYNRHQWERLFWLIMVIPTLIWFKESVLWVAIMSLYANWKTADGAHEAKKAQESESE